MLPVIGLEVHFQLKVNTKLFSASLRKVNTYYNHDADLIDLAYPGLLPILNERVIFLIIKFGIILNSKIYVVSEFDRKHYYYPDLPKGYQITQYRNPVLRLGYIDIPLVNGCLKRIFIKSSHLEEDSGSLHVALQKNSGNNYDVDFNRAGVALVEVVTEPVLHSSYEAGEYLRKLHFLVTQLGICDGNLQDGSFRCDVNVSVRKRYNSRLGIRVEIKNVNSFRYVESVIDNEITRQKELILRNIEVSQETRYFIPKSTKTGYLREKENVIGYRYLPEPDLPIVYLTDNFVNSSNLLLGELPQDIIKRFLSNYNLGEEHTLFLLSIPGFIDYFELVSMYTIHYYVLYNVIVRDYLNFLHDNNFKTTDCLISPFYFSEIINSLAKKSISIANIKYIFKEYWCDFCILHIGQGMRGEIITNVNQTDVIVLIQEIVTIYYELFYGLRREENNSLFFFIGRILLVLGINKIDVKLVTNIVKSFL